MASLEESVRAALAADTSLAAVVGDRIYPGQVPDHDAPTPWVYYLVTDRVPVAKLAGAERERAEIEFDTFGRDYATAHQISTIIKAVLNGYSGGQIERALWKDTESEAVEGGYHFTDRFVVWGTTATVIASPSTNARIVTGNSIIEFKPDGTATVLTITPAGLTFSGVLTGDGSGLTGLPATSPGGASGQVQFNNAGAFAGAAAVTYFAVGPHLNVTALGPSIVPIVAKGHATQTAPYFQCQTSSGVVTFDAAASGALTLRNKANDGTRIGPVLTYDSGAGRTCVILTDDVNNSFTFNPNAHIYIVSAPIVSADKMFNRSGSSNPVKVSLYNGASGANGLDIDNEHAPSSAPSDCLIRITTRNSLGTVVMPCRYGARLTDVSANWRGGWRLLVKDSVAERTAIDVMTNGVGTLIGFHGAAPVGVQSLGGAATDATTTQALANALRTALINLGFATT